MLKNRELKLARMKKGLTQLQLADRLDVKERLITMIETGRQGVDVGLALRIAEALDADARKLFPDTFGGL